MAGGCSSTFPPGAPVEISPIRSVSGIVHASVEIKRWLAELPDVEVVRPGRCPRCHVAARRPGRALSIHGHGVVERDIWGPAELDGEPEFASLPLRRYRCLACGTVIRVGPRGLFARHRYSAAAIGVALALWAVFGREPEEARREVSPWRNVAVETKRRWPSLERWARAVSVKIVVATSLG